MGADVDTPEDTLAPLADALASALTDVNTSLHLGERLDGRTLCSAMPSLRAVSVMLTESIARADEGFARAIAETHAGDSGVD